MPKYIKEHVELKYSIIKEHTTGIEVWFIDFLAAIDHRPKYRNYLLSCRDDRGALVFTKEDISPFYVVNNNEIHTKLTKQLSNILTALSKFNRPPLDKQQKTDVLRHIRNLEIIKETSFETDPANNDSYYNVAITNLQSYISRLGRYLFPQLFASIVRTEIGDKVTKYPVSVSKNRLQIEYHAQVNWFDNILINLGVAAAFLALTEIVLNALDLFNGITNIPYIAMIGMATFYAGWDDYVLSNRMKLKRLSCSLRRAFCGESFFRYDNLKPSLEKVLHSLLGVGLLIVAIIVQVMVIYSRPIKIYRSIADIVLANNWEQFFNLFNNLTRMSLVLSLTGKAVDSGQNKEVGMWYEFTPNYLVNFVVSNIECGKVNFTARKTGETDEEGVNTTVHKDPTDLLVRRNFYRTVPAPAISHAVTQGPAVMAMQNDTVVQISKGLSHR